MGSETNETPQTQARDIFLGALEKTTAAQRVAYLEVACGADQALRQRVDELLKEQAGLGGFLEKPALSGGTSLIVSVTEKSGDRIGRYKLLQQIGEGGTGVVYMADQEEPVRRRVALKIIKLGMDTRNVIARFEAERQALAMMDHPNIAKVLDGGATDAGRPYFVMELVRGIKITEYCDQYNLPTEERLKLFVQVCQAIQHAHQKGIIHRDIKPSNILVTSHDGTPVPKVIDFGIAKATEQRLTDKTLFTQFSTFIGTPAYMSPEQAEMSGLDVDTRSDIYALGVLLYELLTGKTPFDAETLHQATLDECRRTIREQEPLRLSARVSTLVDADLTTTARHRQIEAPKLIHLLSGDLDWIAMKCLEKDRTRRYATTNALAADIQRYLENEPVSARPPSSLYRLQKLFRKHRATVVATTAIGVTLIAGVGASIWQAVRATQAERDALIAKRQESFLRLQAEQERAIAEQERASARLNEYVADINLAKQSLVAGNLGRAVQLLEKHRPASGEPDLRGFEWRYLWKQCQGDEHTSLPPQDGPVHSLACSPSGNFLVSGGYRKTALWNRQTGLLLTNLPKGGNSTAFFPGGELLVTASPTTARIWHTKDWTEAESLPRNGAPFSLSANGRRLATMSRQGVRVWDTANWEEWRLLAEAFGPMAFASDGKTLATDTRNGITLWSLEGTNRFRVLPNSTNLFARGGPWFRSDHVMAFSPDDRILAAARNTLSERGVFVVGLWDVQTGAELAGMPEDPEHIEHTGVISSLSFSPDGQTLATASMDYSIRLWDLATHRRIALFQGHLSEVLSVAFTPDGKTLVSGDKEGSVRMWPIGRQQLDEVIAGLSQPIGFARDGRTLAVLGEDNALVVFDLSTMEPERQYAIEPRRSRFGPSRPVIALSEDMKTVAEGLEDGNVKLWNPITSYSALLKVAERPVDFVALSPDGEQLIGGARFQALRWWDVRQGTNFIMNSEAFRAEFSPDGATLAAFGRHNQIELWDVATHTLRTNILSESIPSFDAAFSPDGRVLAVVCFDDAIRLWDVATGDLLGSCVGHKQGVFSVAFSPDGKTMASASDDSTLKLWNVATQQELLTIRRLGGTLRSLAFSPEGRLLVGELSLGRGQGGLRLYCAPLLGETDVMKADERSNSGSDPRNAQ